MILNDLEIHISIYNDSQLWEIWSFIFPLIPIYFDTEDYKSKHPLSIEVQLLPKRDGFLFKPKKLFIIINNGIKVTPFKIFAQPNCGPMEINSERIKIDDTLDYQLEKDLLDCYFVYFDINPPDPSTKISISIDGIFLDDKPIKLNKFKFHEDYYFVSDSAP